MGRYGERSDARSAGFLLAVESSDRCGVRGDEGIAGSIRICAVFPAGVCALGGRHSPFGEHRVE